FSEQHLGAGNLDFVAVDERRRLYSQRDAVHAHTDAVTRAANHHLVVPRELQHRLEAERGVVRDADVDTRASANPRLPRFQCVLFIVDLNDRHWPSVDAVGKWQTGASTARAGGNEVRAETYRS